MPSAVPNIGNRGGSSGGGGSGAAVGVRGGGVRSTAAKGATGGKVTVTVTHPAPAQPARPAAKPPAAPAAFNPLQQTYTTPQLAALATSITKGNDQAQLVPLRQQAAQIQNTQGTVANRLAGYNKVGDQIMQGVQGQAQTSALTGENAAAQAAQTTAASIDKTGAAATALNGGYMDPQVQAALANQRTLSGTVAGAQARYASQTGTNENDFMANLRASAAARSVEGQQNVASIYGKQLSTNQAARDAILAKQPADAKSLAVSLGQMQFTDQATAKSLGIKTFQANTTASNDAATQAFRQAQLKEKSVTDQATLQYHNAALSEKAGHDYATQQIALANTKLREKGLSASEKDKAQNQLIAWTRLLLSTAGGGAAAQKVGKQTADAINGAVNYYHTLTTVPNSKTGNTVASSNALLALSSQLKGRGLEGTTATELAKYGYISPQTEAALKAAGVPVDPSWTAKRPKK